MRKRSWWERRKDRKAAKARPTTHRDLPPIDIRANQRFEFEGGEFWDVAAMAADITADPDAFALTGISTEEVRAHVEGGVGSTSPTRKGCRTSTSPDRSSRSPIPTAGDGSSTGTTACSKRSPEAWT